MANQFSSAFHVPVSDCAKVTLRTEDRVPECLIPEFLLFKLPT
jgi:hypothetical protein